MNDIFGIKQEDTSNQDNHLVENREKLKISHTPDQLQFREEKVNNIVRDTFKPALNGYEGEDVVLTGKPGTGKTAAVKYIQKNIEGNYDTSELETVYINCKTNNSKQDVFKAIMNSVGLNYKKGVGVGENVSKLFETYNSPTDDVLVIILDEVDALYKDRRDYINDVIYTLKRPHENSDLFEFEGVINVICVSNDNQLFNYLEQDVKDSCFSPETYEFLAYNKDEITQILLQRQEEAFTDPIIDKPAMERIAEVVKQKFDGDIRAGIKILKKLPKHLTQPEQVLSSQRNQNRLVEKAIADVKRSQIEQVLNGKDTHFLLVMSAMIQNFRNDKSKLSYIVDSYRRACEQASLERHGQDHNVSTEDSRAKSRSFVRRKLEYLVDEQILTKERRYDKPRNPYFYEPEVDLDVFEELVNQRLHRNGVKERFDRNKERGVDKSTTQLSELSSDDQQALENLQSMTSEETSE